MQAIVTKYLGPTDTKGERIKATCDAGSVTVAWDYSMSMHQLAVSQLTAKLGWTAEQGYHGQWHGGSMPNSSDMCWVFVETD